MSAPARHRAGAAARSRAHAGGVALTAVAAILALGAPAAEAGRAILTGTGHRPTGQQQSNPVPGAGVRLGRTG